MIKNNNNNNNNNCYMSHNHACVDAVSLYKIKEKQE